MVSTKHFADLYILRGFTCKIIGLDGYLKGGKHIVSLTTGQYIIYH